MSELDLYKWVQEWQPEYRWDKNPDTKDDDVILWVSVPSFEYFYKLLPSTYFDEGGIECHIVQGSIALWASDICEPSGIEIENIFPKQ